MVVGPWRERGGVTVSVTWGREHRAPTDDPRTPIRRRERTPLAGNDGIVLIQPLVQLPDGTAALSELTAFVPRNVDRQPIAIDVT